MSLGRVALGVATGGLSEVARGLHGATQNKFQATAPEVDQQAFLNPSTGLRDLTADRAFRPEVHARQAQQVSAPRITPTRIQTGVSDARAGDAMQARGQQQQALGLLSGAAQGTAPSVAQQQLQQGMDAGLRQQAAMAASARGGGGGQLMAQREAAMQGAQLQQQTAGNAAMLRAQEMAQARGQFADMTSGIRAGDQTAQQLAQQQAQAQAGLYQQGQIAGGQLGLQAGMANQMAGLQMTGLDDTQTLAHLGATLGIDTSTMQGQMQLQQLLSNNQLQTQGINAGVALGNQQATTNLIGGAMGGLGAAAGLLSDATGKIVIKPTDSGMIRFALGAL
jgi:hypothetical protein